MSSETVNLGFQRIWPWPRLVNQHYEETKPEFDEWLHDFDALDAESQKTFDKCNFALLGSLGYPLLNKECLRVTCDLMALFFIYDEYTDKLDGDSARTCADMVMDVLRNPHKERPQHEYESRLGEITRQYKFWLHAIKVASEEAQRRFLKSFAAYVYAVIDEASDRNGGHIRGINEYLELRRLTAATFASFFPVELGLDIPDKVMTHHAMESLLVMAGDILVLTNDLYSYNIEQAAGHGGHNILTVVMNEKGGELLSKFQSQYRVLPSWGPEMDPSLAHWIRGHDCWSFEAERYFGTKGPEIQKHRLVTLLPRSNKPDVTPMMAQPTA
ncbi:isoprenoid synthase domain-containing protein [Lactarius quietus]|nr:isoprenoid synthase domain-containing protein [Lactarius quietus]